MGELELIAGHPFWRGLKPAHLVVLARHAMITHFRPGQVIFQTGDPANRFYCLLTGEVDLWSRCGETSRIKIDTLRGGEVLGWSWLFPPYTWAFDAVANAPTEAIFFYGTPLREECEEDPAFGLEVMQRTSLVMMRRLQATRAKLADLLRKLEPGPG